MRFLVIVFLFAIMLVSGCAQKSKEAGDVNPRLFMDSLRGGPPPVPEQEEINKHPLGSQGNPVRADNPRGELAYLKRLVCSDGNHPSFSRRGSVGEGPYGYIMDVYDVVCSSGKTQEIYMDLYHPGYQEEQPVPGFEIEALENK